MAPTGPTKTFLEKLAEQAVVEAHSKYGSEEWLRWAGTSNPAAGFSDGGRQMLFGDPVTLYSDAKGGNWGKVIKDTVFGPGATGANTTRGTYALNGALTLGLPLALTGLAYHNTPEQMRPHVRGSMAGNFIGGLTGSMVGQRFGAVGQALMAPTLARLGERIGHKFDRPNPQANQVNAKPDAIYNLRHQLG